MFCLVVSGPLPVNRTEAIRRFAMLLVIPVYQTFWILSGTLSGLIYFEEIKTIENDVTKATMFFFGTTMALGPLPPIQAPPPRRTAVLGAIAFAVAACAALSGLLRCPAKSGGCDRRRHLRAHEGARTSRVQTIGDEREHEPPEAGGRGG